MGEKIAVNIDSSLIAQDKPIIPFIVGDGIGVDITPVLKKLVGGTRQVQWMEMFSNEKALRHYGHRIRRPGVLNAGFKQV